MMRDESPEDTKYGRKSYPYFQNARITLSRVPLFCRFFAAIRGARFCNWPVQKAAKSGKKRQKSGTCDLDNVVKSSKNVFSITKCEFRRCRTRGCLAREAESKANSPRRLLKVALADRPSRLGDLEKVRADFGRDLRRRSTVSRHEMNAEVPVAKPRVFIGQMAGARFCDCLHYMGASRGAGDTVRRIFEEDGTWISLRMWAAACHALQPRVLEI